ncbi:hypothetical protein M3202_19670 [Alkalihalobacillus oceani]|uniref:Uncharacterized protein n=1 Tax=Halalkalibacter oceani TaxID=1653776 RepID=A0A9X2DT84_9BACI|nr:hypothetical protein [Halalkalibacter oceani]MCM3716266.1 hypothetical protein [Halalkalibacter oceani]
MGCSNLIPELFNIVEVIKPPDEVIRQINELEKIEQQSLLHDLSMMIKDDMTICLITHKLKQCNIFLEE